MIIILEFLVYAVLILLAINAGLSIYSQIKNINKKENVNVQLVCDISNINVDNATDAGTFLRGLEKFNVNVNAATLFQLKNKKY